jgi:hypothetical protein
MVTVLLPAPALAFVNAKLPPDKVSPENSVPPLAVAVAVAAVVPS